MSAKKHLLLLNHLMELSKTSLSHQDIAQIKHLQSQLAVHNQLNDSDRVKASILTIKAFIENVERNNSSTQILVNFKNYSLYKVLYHYPKIKGKDDNSILKQLLINGFIGAGVSGLAIIIFAMLPLTAPAWLQIIATAMFSSAITYISAIAYGIVNDIFATRSNLPYFLLGHQPQQHSLLRSNDPLVQGVAWGVAATFGPALIAAIAFGLTTLCVATFVPVATFIFPLTLIAMPLIAVGADFYAKRIAQEHIAKRNLDLIQLGSNEYQRIGLNIMSPSIEEKAAWLANSDRNLFGFTKVPLIGVGALVGMIGLSMSHSILPSMLFSASFSVALPAISGLLGVMFIAALGVYTYRNRNTQLDNRFKLDFDHDGKLGDTLYIDAEMNLLLDQLANAATLSELHDSLKESQSPQPIAEPKAASNPPLVRSQEQDKSKKTRSRSQQTPAVRHAPDASLERESRYLQRGA